MPYNHTQRAALTSAIVAAISLGPAPGAGQTGTPSVQYRSPEGVEYRSLPDTDAIKSARAALAADPKNITRVIDLGVAESGARQFREAIATFTRGLEIEPNNALLLRWRGHRYLSVREFDRAFADLTRGSTIDATIYGIWYHLGVVQFVRGDFSGAAASFAKAQPIAPDAAELAGSTDWLWMSLSRAGRGAEAKAMLDRRPDNKPVTNAYTRRLQLYRGEIGPEAVVTAADTDDVQVATLAYGLGNWYLVRGDKAQARKWFERSIQSGGWPAFGFIASEAELRRPPPPDAHFIRGFDGFKRVFATMSRDRALSKSHSSPDLSPSHTPSAATRSARRAVFSRFEARLPAESRQRGSLESRRTSSSRHTAPG